MRNDENGVTMTDVLLVVGNVTGRQWEPLRVAMVRDGLEPVIVRVSAQHANSELFRHMVGIVDQEADDRNQALRQFERDYLVSLVKAEGTSLQSVKAVLMEFRPDADLVERWAWLDDHLPREGVAHYSVQLSADGSEYWLDGDGFYRVSTYKIRS
jgi:hypothetical protein